MRDAKPGCQAGQGPAAATASGDRAAPVLCAHRRRGGVAVIMAALLLSGPVSGDGWLPRRAAAPTARCESREPYRATCVLPRAAWNEEVLRVREAARRECLDNAVILASDRKARVSTTQQENFERLLKEHRALVRSAH